LIILLTQNLNASDFLLRIAERSGAGHLKRSRAS